MHALDRLYEEKQEAPFSQHVLWCQYFAEARVSTKGEQAMMILWFLHYHNIGEGDIFQTSRKTFFLPTEHSEAVGLIALGSCGWWKLSWVQKVIRQTHSRKIWINTKTPLLAQEASELQFVKRPVKDSGNASLYACPVLRFISKHLLLSGHCPKQTLDSALSSTAVMVAVKSPNCEERETMENWEGGQGLRQLTAGLDRASMFQLGSEWLQWDNPWTPTSFKVPILC